MNVDGSGLVNLTNSRSRDMYPTWSPDSSRIAFESNRTGNFDIYTQDAAGASEATRLTSDPATKAHPA